jgi:tyrosinase
VATNGGDPANVERLERNDILHRKNVALLSPEELSAFRRALEEIKDISKVVRSDRRGFFEHAGQHGVPYWRCPHHTPDRLFLPWHRASLYRLEQALQDRVPGVTLPWWDWTATRQIPEPFAAEEVDGQPNTLFKSETLATEADRREGRPVIEETFRLGEDFSDLPTEDEVNEALQLRTFIDFSDRLEELHDDVHVSVRGTMGDFAYAAFDPVFWVHHCMVDRIWWLWQRDNRIDAVPTRDL